MNKSIENFDKILQNIIESQNLLDTIEIYEFFKNFNFGIKLKYKTISELVKGYDTPNQLTKSLYAYTKILLCYEYIKNSKTLNLEQTFIIFQTINKNENIIKIFKNMDMIVFVRFWKLLINENRMRFGSRVGE